MVTGRNENPSRRIRLGMAGGGNDAFIGGVHRIASRIDNHFELVADTLSSTPGARGPELRVEYALY